jgi:acyl-CoA thioesterase FadM
VRDPGPFWRRLGGSACRELLTRAGDGTKLATIRHTTVLTDLAKMKSVAIPDDVMAVMDPHRG